MSAQPSFISNATTFMRDRLARMFPFAYGPSTKHDFRADYGWPEHLEFFSFYNMYRRSGLAKAGVAKTIAKTWEEMPEVWEGEQAADTPDETAIKQHFEQTGIWGMLMEADQRSMVGRYAGAIIRLRDGKPFDQPVDRVPGGITSVAGIIPAWEGQLKILEWDEDQTSDTYGEPIYFQFDEQAVGDPQNAAKSQIRIHRDRILIFSDDGTVNCHSALEAGFDDLSDAAKIKGAGAEGFWKSSRGAPIVESPQGVSIEEMVRGMGVATSGEAIDKLNGQVSDFQAGFDKFLMLGGFTAKPLQISLPQPEEFWMAPVQGFAASLQIPLKELIGNVTGQRASTEDAIGWSKTCMSRRKNRVLPTLHEFLNRLVKWGVLADKPWTIGWLSLLEATPADKMARAVQMSTINANSPTEPVFLPDEIRDEAGFKAAADVEGFAEFVAEQAALAADGAEDAATQTIPTGGSK